jgi:lysophospholipase L1-like esterase
MSRRFAGAGLLRRPGSRWQAGGGAPLSGAVSISPFGDSITAGQGSTDSLGYRSILRLALDAALPEVTATFVGPYGSAPNEHGGDPGATISGIEANYNAWIALPSTAPDIAIVMAGTNDCADIGGAYNGPAAQARFGDLLDAIIASNSDVQIVVLSPPTVNPADTDPADETLRDNLADYAPRCILEARKRSFLTVDLHAESLTWVTGDFDDDVHLSDSGYAKMAAFIQSQVERSIGRILAPSSYPTAPEIVTDPTISTPVVGVSATITPGIVDAFPTYPTNTYRVLDAADDSLISDRGTTASYTPVIGDVGIQLKIEQTSGADVRIGPASTAVASPIAFPTANLVFAFEARADVTESGGLVSQIDGQHGSTPIATASGSARPDYLATSGYTGGPAMRFGAPATGGTATKLDVSASLRASAGDVTICALVNPAVIGSGDQQWVVGHTTLYGGLHIRSNTVSRPQWYDGSYRDTAVAATTGWQLYTWRLSGTSMDIYRGRAQLGSTLIATARALTSPTIGNVPAGGFPLDGLIEGVWAFDAAIVLADLWDWIDQEWPGIAP